MKTSPSSLEKTLKSLRVRQPCPKKWEDMKGSDSKRFCEHCNLHVHNLSAMAPREIKVLAESSGRRCVAYFEDKNGGIQTRARFAWLRRPLSGSCRLVASVLALIFPFSLIGCAQRTLGKINPVAHTQKVSTHPSSKEKAGVSDNPSSENMMLIGDPAIPEPVPMTMGTPIPPSEKSSAP